MRVHALSPCLQKYIAAQQHLQSSYVAAYCCTKPGKQYDVQCTATALPWLEQYRQGIDTNECRQRLRITHIAPESWHVCNDQGMLRCTAQCRAWRAQRKSNYLGASFDSAINRFVSGPHYSGRIKDLTASALVYSSQALQQHNPYAAWLAPMGGIVRKATHTISSKPTLEAG